MKTIFCLLLITFFSVSAAAQKTLVETNFEKSKPTLSLFHYAEGEDASSGFDYLVYRKKSEVIKIRVIWSSSTNLPEVEDFYYDREKPVLWVKFSAKKNQYKTLVRGKNVQLKLMEKIFFTDAKLKTWIENGKSIDSTDTRWNETESRVLDSFKYALDGFRESLAESKQKK